MAADDHPFDALQRHFELENSSASPAAKAAINIVSHFPLMWPFDKAVDLLKAHLAADSLDRLRIMLATCMEEVRRHEKEIHNLKQNLSADELQRRADVAKDMFADAARRAVNTRAKERVKRIGLILAHGMIETKLTDADEIEEMMRIAMELSDSDITHLRELVRIEGHKVESAGRIERYAGHTDWERCSWGNRIDGELDSIFSKLVSYGLVSQIPPPNNLNISADFQNRYLLLRKGLRFVNLIQDAVSAAN